MPDHRAIRFESDVKPPLTPDSLNTSGADAGDILELTEKVEVDS